MTVNISIPSRFTDATVQAWSEYTGNVAVADQIDTYVSAASRHFDDGKGLLLLGPPGVGKTYLACAVLNALHPKYTVRFITLYTYLRSTMQAMEWHDAWLRMSDDDAFQEWQQISRELGKIRRDYDFLVLDDVGMEYRSAASDWSVNEFQILLRSRYDRALPTIITSNRTMPEWLSIYGAAMESFVQEVCAPLMIVGDDLRLRQ